MTNSVQLKTDHPAVASFPLWGKVAFLGLALVKLWLVSGMSLYAIGNALYDDRLFLNLANAILAGDWLGPYNNLTLAKGPFYPLWIAATFQLGIPLLLAQHLLYIASCAVFIIAVRPVLSRLSILLLMWAVLLFNPMSYTAGVMTRVIREGIYPSLTILVTAGAVGLLARHDRPPKNLFPWSICLGCCLSAFWLTREEGIWMIPSVVAIIGFAVVRMRQRRPDRLPILSLICVLPFCIWMIAIGTVAGINKNRYGLFTTNEFKSHDFLAAYGALTRVKHAHWQRYYPVPRETRGRIYRISPAFAELAPLLEGYIGAAWFSSGCSDASLCEDIGGGWFTWALRDAVAAAGYYKSAESAANYYRRLAQEINAACDGGQIECGAERASMTPPWHSGYASPLLNKLMRGAAYLGRFGDFYARPIPSTGTEDSLKLFRDLTGSQLSNGSGVDDIKISILSQIGKIYQITVPILIVLALIGYIRSTMNIFRTGVVKILWLINTALLIALVIRLLILAIIDVTSFPSFNTMYLAPAYPLLLILVTLALSGKYEKCSIFHQGDRKFH